MSAHPATEVLSAYLDRELVEREQLEVEAHVEECPGCQHRLDGLRRVVDQLQRIPSARPPLALARGVETQVTRALRERRLGPVRKPLRIELPHPMVGVGFALTVGLAMLLVFFSQSASQRPEERSRVILTPRDSTPGFPEGQRVDAGGRSFVLVGDVWFQSEAIGSAASGAVSAARIEELVARYGWLPDLLALGRDVVFATDDGETVRVTAGPRPPGSRPRAAPH